MIIPIANTGHPQSGAYVAIFFIVIFLLRFFYKRGKDVNPTSSQQGNSVLQDPYVEACKARKEKKKKRRQTAEWKKKVKQLSKLQKGDNQAKISSAVGKPDSIQKGEDRSGLETWVYDCGTEGKRSITFKDGFIEKIEVKY